MAGRIEYETSNYTAPPVLASISLGLSYTRFSGSKNFADLVSPNYNDQKEYTNGLVVLVSIMGSLVFIWASVLIILKYKGESVGCASGRSFQKRKKDEFYEPPSDTELSTDAEDCEASVASKSEKFPGGASTHERKEQTEKSIDERVQRRQRRTRIAYFVSGVGLLVCLSLLLAFSFSPIRQSTRNVDELLMNAQGILDQVKANVKTVESASAGAKEALSSTSLDIATICPNYVDYADLGVDLPDLSAIVGRERDNLQTAITTNVTMINETLSSIQATLDRIQTAVERTDDNLWVFPAVLLVAFVTTIVALVAAILSWTGKGSTRFEKRFAYGVLPFVVVVAVVCWIIATGAAISTLISSDVCVGNPDATVQAILEKYSVAMNSTSAQLISRYTNGCRGSDPTDVLTDIETSLQNATDSIWKYISLTDAVGRDELSSRCGKSVEPFLDGARNLARSLTWTRKVLLSTISSLECAPINEIYVATIHDSFCTDSAQSMAIAYILFSVAAICGMTMVSLRASLYTHVDEEEVYDENEVAENMILNEHEEYLNYISKFKHEWEEYRGIAAAGSFGDSEGSSGGSFRSEEVSGSWTERGDENMSLPDDSDCDEWQLNRDDSLHDYESIDSITSEDLSFPSLNSKDYEDDPLALPPMLGNRSEEEELDFFPDFLSSTAPDPDGDHADANVMDDKHNGQIHDTIKSDEASMDDDDDLYKSLHFVQSPASARATSSASKSNRSICAIESGIEISLTASTVLASNKRTDRVSKSTGAKASPEVLDKLNYFSVNELPSPSSRDMTKASTKMNLVIGKFEI